MITINEEILKRLKLFKLTLEEYYILFTKYYNTGWTDTYQANAIYYSKLKKREFLSVSNTLTDTGINVCLKILGLIEEEALTTSEQMFEEFWNEYPKSDKWGIFPITRKTAVNRRGCKLLYNTLMQEGVSHTAIIKGLKHEVATKKATSNLGCNNMKYMQNSETWLRNRTFEAWAEEEPQSPPHLHGKDLS